MSFGGNDRSSVARDRRPLGDEHALAVADLDDAHHREAVQRLADGRAPDAHALRQLPFGRETSPRRQLADGLQDLLRHRLGQLLPRRLLDRTARAGALPSIGLTLLPLDQLDLDPVGVEHVGGLSPGVRADRDVHRLVGPRVRTPCRAGAAPASSLGRPPTTRRASGRVRSPHPGSAGTPTGPVVSARARPSRHPGIRSSTHSIRVSGSATNRSRCSHSTTPRPAPRARADLARTRASGRRR